MAWTRIADFGKSGDRRWVLPPSASMIPKFSTIPSSNRLAACGAQSLKREAAKAIRMIWAESPFITIDEAQLSDTARSADKARAMALERCCPHSSLGEHDMTTKTVDATVTSHTIAVEHIKQSGVERTTI